MSKWIAMMALGALLGGCGGGAPLNSKCSTTSDCADGLVCCSTSEVVHGILFCIEPTKTGVCPLAG